MKLPDELGMDLKNGEEIALAHLIVARLIHHTEDWLEWEDYPNLGEHAFERLEQAVRDLALHHSGVSKNWQRLKGIDAADLLERATA